MGQCFSTCPQLAIVAKGLSEKEGQNFAVNAHYAAKRGVQAVANFLGGCGAGRLYVGLEPNGDIKSGVFFPTNKDTIFGNVLEDDFEYVWNNNEFLCKLRTREELECHEADGRILDVETVITSISVEDAEPERTVTSAETRMRRTSVA